MKSLLSLTAGFVLIAQTSFAAPAPVAAPTNPTLSPDKTAAKTLATKPSATAPAFNCSDLRRATLRLSAHASNLANIGTTRIATGGPYKPLEVTCNIGGAFCNVEAQDLVKRVYDPKHPDADANGYVQYPMINIGNEYAGFNTAAAEVKALATLGICKSQILDQGSLAIVKYHSDFEVVTDTLQFKDGRVESWTRQTREGKMQSFSFKNDGSMIGI